MWYKCLYQMMIWFTFPSPIQWCSQDAMVKDTLERATEPNLNIKAYLEDAYIHPVFKSMQIDSISSVDDEENNPIVATKRNSRKGSIAASDSVLETGIWETYNWFFPILHWALISSIVFVPGLTTGSFASSCPYNIHMYTYILSKILFITDSGPFCRKFFRIYLCSKICTTH